MLDSPAALVAITGELLDPGGLTANRPRWALTLPIQPQPQVKEWIELFINGVISREELRHQLALATANAISSPTLDDSPATKAGETPGRQAAARQRRAEQAVEVQEED